MSALSVLALEIIQVSDHGMKIFRGKENSGGVGFSPQHALMIIPWFFIVPNKANFPPCYRRWWPSGLDPRISHKRQLVCSHLRLG